MKPSISIRAAILLITFSLMAAGRVPADVAPPDLLDTIKQTSGICVQVGIGDGGLAALLATNRSLIVHALERDRTRVSEARSQLLRDRVYGQVAVESWRGKALPYADNLVNLLIVEEGGIPQAELLRVLVPNGTAWIRSGTNWSSIRKPWPNDFDEWTHWRHGADGNMVSHDSGVTTPTGLRWVSGPAQDAGGQKWYYDHVLISAKGRNYYVYEEEITARDAFNGSLIWSRPLKAYSFKETGGDLPTFPEFLLRNPKAKVGTRTSKVRPVARGNKLYAAAEGKLVALDGANGRTVEEFGPVSSPRELLLTGNDSAADGNDSGSLIISDGSVIRSYDLKSRKPLWEFPLSPERIVSGDGKLFCLADDLIVAVDVATGKELWRVQNPEAAPALTCTYSQGVLVLEMSSWRDDPNGCRVLVYSGKDGKFLWKKEYKPDLTHFKESRAFFARDLVWLQTVGGKVSGYDPLTGKQKQVWLSRGKHCATPLATDRYFIAPECEFTDLVTGERSRARMFKSACRLPFIPANGLLYSFPVQCECFPMLRGYMGLTGSLPGADADSPRLERGSTGSGRGEETVAFVEPVAKQAKLLPILAAGIPDEWPTYRHDSFRSGATASSLSRTNVTSLWATSLASSAQAVAAGDWNDNPFTHGNLTPPVAAGGHVFVAVPDEHRVVALDAKSGQVRWNFTAGGRIDLPPTIDEGLCLFGSHDGWIYCVKAEDGNLVWRFRGAPHETRIMAYGQIESPWPVPGSVLVENGIAYVAAGRHPMCDGGVQVLALKARTGELVWEKNINDITFAIKDWYGGTISTNRKIGLDFEPVDIFVRDGEGLAMSRWRFNPETGDTQLRLGNTTYKAGAFEVPRGIWGYGIRQTKKVQPRPPVAFDHTRIHSGSTNDLALIVAGDVVVKGGDCEIEVGGSKLPIPSSPVHDGIIAAYGRIYASLENGALICLD